VVWTANDLPFGWVRVRTGTRMALRFPGQWFQTETGLHQKGMCDDGPAAGRYLHQPQLLS